MSTHPQAGSTATVHKAARGLRVVSRPGSGRSKAESPTDLPARSWRYTLRSTAREFLDDQCTDLAAALTYYSVLALFPAILALFSLLGVVGQAKDSVETVLEILRPLVAADTLSTLEPFLTNVATNRGASVAVGAGVLGALFSASGYVNAFSRAMNRIYEVEEGRPVWKLRPAMLIVTLLGVFGIAAALVMIVATGPLADSIGQTLGIGETLVTAWGLVKWPVLVVVVLGLVGLLYYATPNVRQPKFRWISVGAGVAILVWLCASVGFGFYVANFSSYDATYGSVAGVVVTLLWLWLTNIALLLGAELDAELERSRQLEAGMVAEHNLQLPIRDDSGIIKKHQAQAKLAAAGTALRQQANAAAGHFKDGQPGSRQPEQYRSESDRTETGTPGEHPAASPQAHLPTASPVPRTQTAQAHTVAVAGASGLLVGAALGWLVRRS